MGRIKYGDRIILRSHEFAKANYPIKKPKEPPELSRIEKHLLKGQQPGGEV